jgi:L-lactate dehydrogenase
MTESSLTLKPQKITIIGSGKVGTTFAYALLLSGRVGEIVLIDMDKQRTEGEVMDLNDAVPLSHPTRITLGDYPDCSGADVVVIAAGASQKPGETRLDLLKRNTAIFAQIVPQIMRHNPQPLILNATNPVDILSYAAWKLSGLPPQRVIGSGTILDTARFRALLSAHFNLDARSVHAYIIGEHGDSEVAVWSSANIAGMPLDDYCRLVSGDFCGDDRSKMAEQVRNAGYEILSRKGATYYAVAVGLLRIVESILRDQHSVLSVSNLVPGYYGIEDVYLSLPSVVGRGGVETILPLNLDEAELAALHRSAEVMQGYIHQLDLK